MKPPHQSGDRGANQCRRSAEAARPVSGPGVRETRYAGRDAAVGAGSGLVALTRLFSDDVDVAIGGMVAFGPQDVTGGDVIDA